MTRAGHVRAAPSLVPLVERGAHRVLAQADEVADGEDAARPIRGRALAL